MKSKLLGLSAISFLFAAAAHAQATTVDSAAIVSQLEGGVDSGMGVATKVVGVLITLFIVGFIIKLVKKSRQAG